MPLENKLEKPKDEIDIHPKKIPELQFVRVAPIYRPDKEKKPIYLRCNYVER